MSFRILADAAAISTPPSPGPGGSGYQDALGGFAPTAKSDGMSGLQKTALALVVDPVLLVVLALVLATTSLRRGMEDAAATPADAPAPAD
jgi:hypothetical protein